MNAVDEELARAAVLALEDAMDEDRPDLLMEIYKKSKFPSVRKVALYSFEDMIDENEEYIPFLAEILNQEKDVDQRRMVIRMLGDSESDEAVPILEKVALEDENRRIRTEAVAALGEIGTIRAREALIRVLEKK
jgi:HEAT repeat protein